MHTPASVHFGTAEQIRAQRQVTLNRAYQGLGKVDLPVI
jgi:hypothetical protein